MINCVTVFFCFSYGCFFHGLSQVAVKYPEFFIQSLFSQARYLCRLVVCISPIRIKNPNLGLTGPNAQFKDCVSQYINVPCGVCHECVAKRQLQYVQRLQMEELVNHFFFCTLTYNNEMMPQVVTSTGYSIRYADVSDVQKMFKRLRKRNAFGRPFRYFGVSELGSGRGRPH